MCTHAATLTRPCSFPISAGRHLAALPVDAKIGKLLVLAAALGCLAPALSIAAAASHKSPFQPPFDQQDAANRARRAMCAAGKPQTQVADPNSRHSMDSAWNRSPGT